MSLTGVIALLQAALALLTLVTAHPELSQSARDDASQIAQQAITEATQALSQPQAPNASTQTTIPMAGGTPVSTLINTQACPQVTVPACATHLTANYNSSECLTGYTCASPPPTTTPAPLQTTAASCVAYTTTYANDVTMECSTKPGPGVGCPLGVPFSMWMCSDGQWISSTQATDSSCTVQRRCGDLTVPNGGVVMSPGGAANFYQMCTNGALVHMSIYTYAGATYNTYCAGDPVSA